MGQGISRYFRGWMSYFHTYPDLPRISLQCIIIKSQNNFAVSESTKDVLRCVERNILISILIKNEYRTLCARISLF